MNKIRILYSNDSEGRLKLMENIAKDDRISSNDQEEIKIKI